MVARMVGRGESHAVGLMEGGRQRAGVSSRCDDARGANGEDLGGEAKLTVVRDEVEALSLFALPQKAGGPGQGLAQACCMVKSPGTTNSDG